MMCFKVSQETFKFNIQYNYSPSWYTTGGTDAVNSKCIKYLCTANFEGQYLCNNTINTLKYPSEEF